MITLQVKHLFTCSGLNRGNFHVVFSISILVTIQTRAYISLKIALSHLQPVTVIYVKLLSEKRIFLELFLKQVFPRKGQNNVTILFTEIAGITTQPPSTVPVNKDYPNHVKYAKTFKASA